MKNLTPNKTSRRDNRLVSDLNMERKDNNKKFKMDRRSYRGQKTINQNLAWLED